MQIKCPVLHKVCEFDKENDFTKLTENDKKVTDRDKTLVFRYDEKFNFNEYQNDKDFDGLSFSWKFDYLHFFLIN